MASMDGPWHTLEKNEQKHLLLGWVRDLIDARNHRLERHERFFLTETVGYVIRGLFGMALNSLNDAYEDAGRFTHYAMDDSIVALGNPERLLRLIEQYEFAPAQERPVFC